jgi:hypothetical protein
LINEILNVFFLAFHTSVIFFNLLGWIWRATRRWNLLALILTALSWFGLGIWYGIGFCPCTQWHWQVRKRLGLYDMPDSYIKFLVDQLTGLNINAFWLDRIVMAGFLLALTASIYLNIKDQRAKKRAA